MKGSTPGKRGRFHGVLSLVLVFVAVGIAMIHMFKTAGVAAAVYLGLMVVATPVLLYSYCAKCTCRDSACSHVFPGMFTRFLPARKPGAYSLMDYLGTALSLMALFGFPQFWLWRAKSFFLVFWIILAAALIEILFFVCRNCNNQECPIKGTAAGP
jgi:hypothetical protein